MKSKYTKLFSNTAIFTAGKFISKLIVLFMLPFYTSCLSSAEYSSADLITNLCNLIIPIACLGVSEGIFRGAAMRQSDKEAFFTNGTVIMLAGSAVFLALSPLLALFDYFSPYVWLIVLYVLASNIHSVCSQYVCAIGKSKLFAIQGVLNTILIVLLNILFLALWDMGVTGYVLSVAVADFASAVFVFFVAGLYRAFKPSKINFTIIKELMRFCLPLIPSTVFWWITGVSDRYLVAYICSDEVNGLYSVAYKIPTLLTYVVVIFNDAWKLSAVSESDNIEECTKFYSRVFRYYQAIMFMGGACIAVASPLLSMILFADSYYSAWVYVPVLSAATVFTALDTFFGSAYFTVKRTGMSFFTAFFGALINIVLNLIMIPKWGAMGASIATFISYFLVFFVRAITMHRFIPFKIYPLKIIINTVLICVLSVVMTAYGGNIYGIVVSVIILLICLAYNLRDIYVGIKDVITTLKSRKSA